MAIDKLTPRYLNFEDDERLVKRVEMTDAQNIRIDADDNGDAGVVKNVVGNTVVAFNDATADALPSGDNKVIGSVHNNVKGEILFFVHNSNGAHRIYKYDDSQERVLTVYKNEFVGGVYVASADTLGFKSTDYVDGAVLVDKDGDTILYFTNGKGEPKKINVDKAIRGDYPEGYESVEAYISLIKKPPLEAPTFTFESNPDIASNRVLGRQFQFACQYVYDDGEVSAISPISKVTKTYTQTQVGFFDLSEYAKIDNEIEITCKRTDSDIRKIRFLAREGNTGVFFIVKDVVTSRSVSDETISIRFSNEKAYTPISNSENNKLFDAVGESVKAISISGNRIFLGNYTEGFEPVDVAGSKILTNYHPLPQVLEISNASESDSDVKRGFFNGVKWDGDADPSTPAASGAIPTSGRFITHYAKIDFSEITDDNVNDYKSVFVSYRFSRLKLNYFGATTIADGGAADGSDRVTENRGFMHKASDIQDSINIPLSQNYTSATAAIEEIANAINNRLNHSVKVGARSGINDKRFIRGVGWDGTMDFKVEAKRNFSGFDGALSGANVITLFLNPLSVSVSSQNTSNGKKPIPFNDYQFEPMNINTGQAAIRTIQYAGGGEPTPIAYGIKEGCTVSGGEFNALGFFDTGDEVTTSFKAGANHAFGIVHQDKNGRLSTVTPLPDAEVGWFDDSAREGFSGRASMVIRIPDSVKPPENAVRWFPVYAGNTSIGNFIQYTANDAFNPTNTESLRVPDNSTITDRMYVSARGFEGKEESYIDNYTPKIKYSFATGDVMKVISVDEERTYSKEFPVLEYSFLTADDNPLVVASTATATGGVGFSRTGYFWVIRRKDNESEFIVEDASASGNAWRNKCLVEVRTPKYSSDDKVYYEVGESYEISNAGLSNRSYSGEREATAFTNLEVIVGENGRVLLTSSDRVYLGDVLNINVVSGNLEVIHVFSSGGLYYIIGDAPDATAKITPQSATGELSSTQLNEAVVELEAGDVYFRKRLLNYGYYNGSVNTFESYFDYVEDYRVNDFIPDISRDYGKPNAFSEEARRVHRSASITYSDAHVMDSDRLSLSSFNNSLANFLDIKNKYGSIQRLVDIEDAFYAIQEHKVTLFPVNRNVIQTAGGDASVTLSTDVVNINSSKSFAGDYGCGSSPESVVYYDGVLYFADSKSNKVFSISSKGINEISDIFADSYIADKLSKTEKAGEYNLYSGIDPNNDEYLFSGKSIINKRIQVDIGAGADNPLFDMPAAGAIVGKTNFAMKSVDTTTFGEFGTLNFDFDDVDVNFEDLGNGVVYVDDAFADNAMELDTSVDSLSTGVTNIVYTDKDNTFLGVAQLDNTNKLVSLDAT